MIRQINTLLVILASFVIAYWLRFQFSLMPASYLLALLFSLLLSAIIFPATGVYRSEFEWALMRKLRRLIASWSIVIVILVSIAAMMKISNYYSRIWFGSWVIICGAGLVVVFSVTHSAAVRARRQGKDNRDIVLVGAGQTARRIEDRINNDPLSGMSIVGRFGNRWQDGGEYLSVEGLAEFVDSNSVQEVWIAVPWDEKVLLEKSLLELQTSVVNINVVPDFYQYRLLNQEISEWGGLPVINLAGVPITPAELKLKELMDWLFSLVLVILLSPLLLIIALIILVSDGRPVIFHQKRHGVGGNSVDILKFRTMKNSVGDSKFRQAEKDDQRVITAGRFLRKTSLDELPQLLNVLRGDMSLVGPRPHPMELNQEYMSRIPKYMMRHKMKPGITGWAQINGYRGETETEEKMAQRIEHDLWYIQNWSLWLDLKILLMTPLVMIHRNAY